MTVPDKPLSCVPFARAHSGIDIRGDAYTWWDQAAGRYPRGPRPAAGAVMVLAGYSGSNRAHVAVVRRIVSRREIRIDHANWLNNGAIFLDDPVADISADNDWSQVLVWNVQTHAWGTHVYNVQGFIGGSGNGDETSPGESPMAPD
ncbi:MAG: CHAP domain-containing protein [Alphaproteobacteria bacterium]|nr:CHAP domain-containing protein [Alphaproteobacteria bacterium]MBV9694734.1 CHAP domain-containing protein [Alphaproteobacteria bacterium]